MAKAIQSAGGFTLYAKETRVSLVRDRKSYDLDVKLAQKFPGVPPIVTCVVLLLPAVFLSGLFHGNFELILSPTRVAAS